MSTPSAIPLVMDGLVAVWSGLDGLDVVEGPGWDSQAPRENAVFVGMSDPESEDPNTAARSDQGWAWLGHSQRDETGSILCVAMAWNGQDSKVGMPAARAQVFATMTRLADAIVANPGLGLGLPLLNVSGIEGVELREGLTDDGVIAYLLFGVPFRARLG